MSRLTIALAVAAIVPAIASVYFFVFWTWVAFWRRHAAITYLMLLGSFFGFALAVALARDIFLSTRIEMPTAVRGIGWIVVIMVCIVGTIADRQIGFRVRSFMPFFETNGSIELVTTGAYAIVRHPIYATGVAFQLGMFLATGYVAIAASCIVFALGAQWFTRREEEHLVELLADPNAYVEYRKRVPRLLPWPR